jgi:hypothetical protein
MTDKTDRRAYPEPPDRLAQLRMIADTEVELDDPETTEQRRVIILEMLAMLEEGHVVRDDEGRFRLTTTGMRMADELRANAQDHDDAC